jgi:hypothetical protein
MMATPAFSVGCQPFDAGQVVAYVRWACAAGLIPRTCSSVLRLDDCSCWADGPTPGDLDSPNSGVPWSDPVTDDACWIDDTVPASYEFLGFQPTEVDLGDIGPTRTMIDLASGGGVATSGTVGWRSVRVSGTLWATSCEGLAYGLRWLRRALTDACLTGDDGCTGVEMCVRTCCPPAGGNPDANLATLRQVSVLAGPTPLPTGDVATACDDILMDVEFVLAAGSPHLWWPATVCADQQPATGAIPSTDPDPTCTYSWTWGCTRAGPGHRPGPATVLTVSCATGPDRIFLFGPDGGLLGSPTTENFGDCLCGFEVVTP